MLIGDYLCQLLAISTNDTRAAWLIVLTHVFGGFSEKQLDSATKKDSPGCNISFGNLT